MTEKIRIALDGPGGAGKSTIAKLLAAELGMEYIDTGAMYRALGYKAVRDGVEISADNPAFAELLEKTELDFSDGNIILDGENVNSCIRTPEISMTASEVSAIPEVREKLVNIQRKIASGKSVVMDGRDIGTNVLKDAEVKIFMTASAEERAARRFRELEEKGENVSYEQVLADIRQRDYNDTHRKINPLRAADDAVILDTEGLDIEQVVTRILMEVEKHGSTETV